MASRTGHLKSHVCENLFNTGKFGMMPEVSEND